MDHRAPPSHYDLLQVAPWASPELIRAAYRAMVQRAHPDRHPDDPTAVAHTTALNAAYAVLSDPALRAAYDHQLTLLPPPEPAAPAHEVVVSPTRPPLSRSRPWLLLLGTYLALGSAAMAGVEMGARGWDGWVILWWVVGVLVLGMPRCLRVLRPSSTASPFWPIQLEAGWCVMAMMAGLMISRSWVFFTHL